MSVLPAAGDVVASKYRVVREIGRGGMGVVYEVVNIATDARAAMKMLLPSTRGVDDTLHRFRREARAAGRLRSRFTPRVFDQDETIDGALFFVMELLEGRDLGTELRESGPLPIDDACAYIVQACAALAEAHDAGIVHRDLKPSNLFLERGTRSVKVVDFGVSKMMRADVTALTGTTDMLGTCSYMSPEQLRTSRDVDNRCDVWGLGVILYRALEGKLPWSGTGAEIASSILSEAPVPPVARVEAPREVVAAVAKALAKEPENRYRDVRDLANAVAPFATRSPATAEALGELSLATGPRSAEAVTLVHTPTRSRTRSIAALVVVVAAMAAAAFVVVSKRRATVTVATAAEPPPPVIAPAAPAESVLPPPPPTTTASAPAPSAARNAPPKRYAAPKPSVTTHEPPPQNPDRL